MIVKCINLGSSAMLTVSRVYRVEHQNEFSYFIMNDQGMICPYLKENFVEVSGENTFE